jgi:polyferredoxin
LNVILIPVTLLIFTLPVLVYILPLINSNLLRIIYILIAVWIGIFLSSVLLLSSYCGFLCPVTKIFELAAFIKKDRSILSHRFPVLMGTIVKIVWFAGVAYTYLRFFGNVIGFLPEEEAFSQIGLLILFGLYTIALILVNTRLGRDELGHYLCPISPFLKAGIALNKSFQLPGYRLVTDTEKCKLCGLCNRTCTYQNNVMEMVQANKMNYNICSNCGKCMKACKTKAITRKWCV